MKKNLLIAIVMVGAMFEASAMVSPKERTAQGFRYSQRSIIVNKYGRLVIPKRLVKSSNSSFLDDEGNFVLDEWFEWNDLPSNFFGGRPYGGNHQTGHRDFSDMVADLKQASENEQDIDVSKNEFQSWENDLRAPYYFRDMKIVDRIFGVRKEKVTAQRNISNAFLTPLNDLFDHELEELNDSLENVKKELKSNPTNKMLIDQKKLVESEIRSFQHMNNRDSFYRSSMKRSDFNIFQQCRSRE